jgi:hypothetical protein
MVGWFEAVDDWCENAALTRSRHLIDGSLSLDGFRSGWMAANGSLGPMTGSRVFLNGLIIELVEQRLRLF